MKTEKIVNFLLWIANKIDRVHFGRCTIALKVEADFTHFIPDDKKWHYYAMTIEHWMKINNKPIEKKQIYMDGIRVSSCLREVTDGTDKTDGTTPIDIGKGVFFN